MGLSPDGINRCWIEFSASVRSSSSACRRVVSTSIASEARWAPSSSSDNDLITIKVGDFGYSLRLCGLSFKVEGKWKWASGEAVTLTWSERGVGTVCKSGNFVKEIVFLLNNG